MGWGGVGLGLGGGGVSGGGTHIANLFCTVVFDGFMKSRRIILHFSGASCPRPGAIPHGRWKCQNQEEQIPEPDFTSILPLAANTFSGKNNKPKNWSK